MDWLQISLTPPPDALADTEQTLLNCGALSVSLGDAGDQPVLEPAPGQTPLWPETVIIGLFEADADVAAIRQALDDQFCGHAPPLKIETLEDRDWVRAWMDDYQPMKFGERLWVCPTDMEPAGAADVILRLDPGLAFGTGTHPTTALCLEWLDNASLEGKTVLDYGCGSGILAVAALLLGAKHAQAVDIDPQALTATRENAVSNGVAPQIDICLPESLEAESTYDVVIANILSGPLVELAPVLAGYCADGGELVLSGILASQSETVTQAYSPWFGPLKIKYKGEWVCISGQKC